MPAKPQLVVITDQPEPRDNLRRAAAALGLDLACHDVGTAAADQAAAPAAAVLALEKLAELDQQGFDQISRALRQLAVGTLILAEQAQAAAPFRTAGHQCITAHPDEPFEMLMGRIAALREMRPIIEQLRNEAALLRKLNKPLNEHFTDVNEEMHLAARLQRDFLPRRLPQMPHLRFATIFRPVSWVSGDIYDIMRLDENHVGFYVADAVGHGMPAALLTMFIKRALVTKSIEGHSYTIIDPGQALSRLNDDMVAQNLTNYQFATCCYGVLNTETLTLRLAGAGHPYPIQIDSQAQTRELEASGKLLGVFPEQEYQTSIHQLQPGDKLLMFSDGVEVAFENDGPDKPLRFRAEFGNAADYDVQTMCDRLVEIIDRTEGSLHPRDDVTIVALETLPR